MTTTTIDLMSTGAPSAVDFGGVAVLLNPADNIAVAKSTLQAGTTLLRGSESALPPTLTVAQLIPSGHKFAVREIKQGEIVRRYGQFIGYAVRDIAPGEHVHV